MTSTERLNLIQSKSETINVNTLYAVPKKWYFNLLAKPFYKVNDINEVFTKICIKDDSFGARWYLFENFNYIRFDTK